MYTLYQLLLIVHALAGLLGLAAFWVPVFARKGGSLHRTAGAVFVQAMTVAGITAITLTLLLYCFPLLVRGARELEPAASQEVIAQAWATARLLLALGLLLLVNTRQAVLALRCREQRASLRAPVHQLLVVCLAIASLNLGLHALNNGGILAAVFSILGLGNAIAVWRYCFKGELQNGEWLLAHIGNILGAGIAAHTAFLVFGGRELLAQWLSPDLYLLMWVAPSVVGGVAIVLARRHWMRKLGLLRRAMPGRGTVDPAGTLR